MEFETKDAINIASPFIKQIVDIFVAPKLQGIKDKYNKKELPTSKVFLEYLDRQFQKNAIINTIAFKNSQKFLKDIYIPLTIYNSQNPIEKKIINSFPIALTNKYNNILITDTAGMGKSTLMKKIFLDCIYNPIGIPVFIELRRLNHNKTIIEEIVEQLNSIKKDISNEIIIDLISEGQFIFFLDGYDEITLQDRETVTLDIENFISNAYKNIFFVTSRPESALSSFGNFQEFKIAPLINKQAFNLLRKYDNNGRISTLLIQKLRQEEDLKSINEFLSNPLLVSLLFTAFEYKQVIPIKKYIFYRQVYDAYFEDHDLSKGNSYLHEKHTGLSIDDFHRVIRHIGFICLKQQKIEFNKDEILKIITESKSLCSDLQFKESDLLNDLLKTVPLFIKEGIYYRWSHKSIQEYFAAQFIYLDSKEKQNSLLLTMYNNNVDKYINVLDLYYDMDYKTFRNTIEYAFLCEYKNFYHEQNNVLKKFLPLKQLIEEQELLFHTKLYLVKHPYMSEEEFNDFESTKFREHEAKLELIVKDIEEQYKHDDYELAQIYIRDSYNLSLITYSTKKRELFQLFRNKKNEIVSEAIQINEVKKLNFINEFEDYKIISLNSEVPEVFYKKQNIDILNIFLNNSIFDNLRINHKKALDKYDEIKKDIEINSISNLFEGL